MKKNYLWVVAHSNTSDSSYFVDLKDKEQLKKDLVNLFDSLLNKGQIIERVDFVEHFPGAW